MDEKDELFGRIKDLSHRALEDSYLTHSEFLSQSQQALFFRILKENGVNPLAHTYGGVSFFLFGGYEEADRKLLYFLPYYEREAEVIEQEKEGDNILVLHAYPKNVRFADHLTHRDFLGALMNLGFRREVFGDILTDGTEGYIYLLKSVAEEVKEELVKVKHTDIVTELILPKDCPFRPQFEEKSINVASNRLDSVLGEVFHLSRRDSQILISSESVFVDGRTIKNNAYPLKEKERVSVQGKGKFIFLGENKVTKKGRLVLKVKIYK